MRERNSTQICEEFDVDRRSLTIWVKKGCPSEKVKGSRGPELRFDSDEVRAWTQKVGLNTDKAVGPLAEQLTAARLRKELATAIGHEIKNARSKGELVEREKVEQANVQKFTAIRNKLLSLPSTVLPLIAGVPEVEAAVVLDKQIREVLTELGTYEQNQT